MLIKRIFFNTENKQSKWWAFTVDSQTRSITYSWGRLRNNIPLNGPSKVKTYGFRVDVTKTLNDLIASKLAKGYKEIFIDTEVKTTKLNEYSVLDWMD